MTPGGLRDRPSTEFEVTDARLSCGSIISSLVEGLDEVEAITAATTTALEMN